MSGAEQDRSAARGAAALTLGPGPPLVGEARVPGSKSLAIRAVLAASLAQGTTRVTNLSQGEDVRAALALVAAAGAESRSLAPRAVSIGGRPPGPHRGWAPSAPLDAGESGTLARLASAALALCARVGGPYELRVRGTLARRASPPLLAALSAAGAGLEPGAADTPPGGWPLRVRPIGPPPDVRLVDPVSSQEVSALLLALAAWPGRTRLLVEGEIPSRPYLELTRTTLARFGARIEGERGARGEVFWVGGPLLAPNEPFAVEPDASAAAVALAAGALSGGALRVAGLGADSPQGDVAIVRHLAAFGVEAGADGEALFARGFPRHGAELDLAGEADLAPVLAALAGALALRAARGELGSARARTRLAGLGTLEGKESPRLSVLAGALRALGLAVETGPDTLVVAPAPGATAETPLTLDPRGDHRMAFAFALLSLVRPGLTILDPACVAKSWPEFWSELERLRAARQD